MNETSKSPIKAIIGLGNPGRQYMRTRHNAGFLILEALAARYGGSWQKKDNAEVALITVNNNPLILIKPQTFMNSSGAVISGLAKQGIKAENILVVHDELEQPFGVIKWRTGGSARGHNGLKSIIANAGDGFMRLRFGIDRPADKNQVPDYVLENFKENTNELDQALEKAVDMIEEYLKEDPSSALTK